MGCFSSCILLIDFDLLRLLGEVLLRLEGVYNGIPHGASFGIAELWQVIYFVFSFQG
jgi:hypothetical protein